MAGLYQFIGNGKVKRYNTKFARLLNLILDMSEEQQSRLLDQAKELVDKRYFQRNSCLIHSDYTIEGTSYSSFILDISALGVFIETSEHVQTGQIIDLKIYNPFIPKPIDVDGNIIWSSPDGFGVKFNRQAMNRDRILASFSEQYSGRSDFNENKLKDLLFLLSQY